MDDDPEERLRRLYAANAPALIAYALRRGTSREDAADLVSDVFLAAWRRIDDVPAGDEARLWLYGVARKLLANQRRGERRRDRLGAALREHARTLPEPEPVDPALHAALVQRSGLGQEVEWYARCRWEAAWLRAHRDGDATAAAEIARVLLAAAEWPYTASGDAGGVVAALRETAAAAAAGDPARVRLEYRANCA